MESNSIDPLVVLQLNEKYTLDELRSQFKKLALVYHPDRTGSDQAFILLQICFKTLHKRYKENQKEFIALKNDFTRSSTSDEFRTKKNPYKNITKERFNQIFEEMRMRNVNDTGYGSVMQKSGGAREDIDVPKTLPVSNFNSKRFNDVFDKQELSNEEKKLMVWNDDPTPHDFNKKSLNYEELGVKKISDFSSTQYTDYMKAHNSRKLIDKSCLKNQPSYKNIDELEASREKISFKMTQEDLIRQKEKEDLIRLKENKRIQHLRTLDEQQAIQYQKIKNLLQ
jgi:curved DNA-binding protein CbpA